MGKGDKRRPSQVSDADITGSWCATFGHKMRDVSDVCISCGRTAKEIEHYVSNTEDKDIIPNRVLRSARR